MIKTEKKEKLVEYKPLKKEDYVQIKDSDGKMKIALFTDGSYNKEEGRAGSAVIINKYKEKNIFFRTLMKQSSQNAEFEAALVAIQVCPEETSSLIFIDCQNVIDLIEKDINERDLMKAEYRSILITIKEELKNKREKGAIIEFVWIPSHSLESDLNENKTKRLKELKERFDKTIIQWGDIVRGNDIADKWSKEARQLEKEREIEIPMGALDYALTNLKGRKVQIWEGNLKREIKNIQKMKHKEMVDKQIETYYGKVEIDRTDLKLIFLEKDPKYGSLQTFVFRLLYGGLHSPNNRFDINKKKEDFQENKKRYTYVTDTCANPRCQGCILDTKHICFDCETIKADRESSWDKLKEIYEGIVNAIVGNKKNTFLKWYDDNRKPTVESEEMKEVENEIEEEKRREIQKRKRVNMAIELFKKRKGEDIETDRALKKAKKSENREENKKKETLEENLEKKGQKRDGIMANLEDSERLTKRARKEEKEEEKDNEEEKEKERMGKVTVGEVRQIERFPDISKLDAVAVKEKLTTIERIKQRKRTEKRREARDKKKKKLTSSEYASHGYVNKELKEQVKNMTKDRKKQKRILKNLYIRFLEQAKANYVKFWANHFEKLNEEHLDVRKLTGSRKSKDTTIT